MNENTSVAQPHAADDENTLVIILVSCVATIGGFLFGFDSGVINGTVDGLRLAFNSEGVGTGFNVASMLLGCAVGAFFAGRLADIYGRRTLLLVASVFFLISAWGSGVSESSLEFVIYRVLGGLAVGAASVMAPAYISEVTPARFRGAMASVQQIAIIVGLFVAFISNYTLAKFAGSSIQPLWMEFEAWRWMFWVEMLPAALFFLALLFIPESPRFSGCERSKGCGARCPDASLWLDGGGTEADLHRRIAGGGSSSTAAHRSDRSQVGRRSSDRVGGYWACHVSAARRHQRCVLLRRRSMAVRWVLGIRCAVD